MAPAASRNTHSKQMRTIKIILGLVSLLTGVLFGALACLCAWAVIAAGAEVNWLLGFCIAAAFALAFGASGRCLIASRRSALSKQATGWITCLWLATTLIALRAVPAFIRARTTSAKNACINNLRQIDGAKQQWGLENNQETNACPTW